MFIHDIIKIRYINEGYLPNYPYHMITDREMFDAFLKEDEGFFAINYPLLDTSLQVEYNELLDGIKSCIQQYTDESTDIPSWVYSYMLGNVISVDSNVLDIMYLYDLLNIDPEVKDVFGEDLQRACYDVSTEWISKLPVKYGSRPATIFGEAHIIKSLRLAAVNVLKTGGVD